MPDDPYPKAIVIRRCWQGATYEGVFYTDTPDEVIDAAWDRLMQKLAAK